MNVLIDILHPAHLNLFKRIINNNQSINFIVTCINRGKLPQIAEKEIKNVPINIIGKHRGTMVSIIFEANFIRFFQLWWFLRNKRIDVGISFGSFLIGAILRLKGKPNIHLSDDPERKWNAIFENITCTERYLPSIIKPSGKVKTFNALKEWSYLSPKYFKPNTEVLQEYNLQQKNYIFIREVSTGSLNYLNQKQNIIASFANKLSEQFKVVLSLEDKSATNLYPKSWILLNEPVEDIHSLMYFSKIVVSSGDSIAREGAMLGVPSIYCGVRDMSANKIMIDKGMLLKVSPNEVPIFVTKIISGEIRFQNQEIFREQLLGEWDDVTEFMIKQIKKYER